MSNLPPPPPENPPEPSNLPPTSAPPTYSGGPVPGAPAGTYASWGSRVLSYIIDGLVSIPALIVIGVGVAIGLSGVHTTTANGMAHASGSISGGGFVVMVIGIILVWVIQIWNICIRQGKTGQSIGKSVMHTKLISEATGQPVGAGKAFLRALCHFFDGLLCDLGFLWPLWDAKRQTFADKLTGTVVVPA